MIKLFEGMTNDRFNAYDCAGAGSTDNGLRDSITFDAQSGDEFWSRNYDDYWTRDIDGDGEVDICPKGGCSWSPLYYVVNDSNAVGRFSSRYDYPNDYGYRFEDNWEAVKNTHSLRCIKGRTGDIPIIQPDEPCIGFGCLFF